VSAAGGYSTGLADEEFCYEECDEEEVGTLSAILSAQKGFTIGPGVGLSLGAQAGKAASVFMQVSLENAWGAIAVGGDVAIGGAGPTVVGEVRPFGHDFPFIVSAYSRYLFDVEALRPEREKANQAPGVDVGLSVGSGRFFGAASFYRKSEGVIELQSGIEGGANASAWLTVVLGVRFSFSVGPRPADAPDLHM
jgi:hypothetical protein